jgi:hypothetical protein
MLPEHFVRMPSVPQSFTRTEEIQEIIGHIPHWIVRRGITILFLLLLLLITLSNFISIPVSIQAEAILYAKEQPFRLAWMKTGPEMEYQVMVSEKQQVQQNDTVMVETNTQTGAKTYHTTHIEGQVAFFRGTEDKPRASVMLVTPQYSELEIELKVPIEGSGQIRIGQKALLRLDEFPESKYGFLIGYVASTFSVPIDGFYRVKVGLTNGMVTNIHRRIPLQANLHGRAQIVTENVSVFNKIFGRIL